MVSEDSSRAGPRTLEYGGGGIESQRDNVSGVSRKGESMRWGLPLLYWGSWGFSPGKFWEIMVPERRF